MTNTESKFIQLLPFERRGSPVLLALDDQGQVWEYRDQQEGWCPFDMKRETWRAPGG